MSQNTTIQDHSFKNKSSSYEKNMMNTTAVNYQQMMKSFE